MPVSSRALSFAIYEDEDCRVSESPVKLCVGAGQTGQTTRMHPSTFPPFPRGDTDHGGKYNNDNDKNKNGAFTVKVPSSVSSSATSSAVGLAGQSELTTTTTTLVTPQRFANGGPFIVRAPSTPSSSTLSGTRSVDSGGPVIGTPCFSMCSLLQSLPQQQPTLVGTPLPVRQKRLSVTQGAWRNFGPDNVKFDDIHEDDEGREEDGYAFSCDVDRGDDKQLIIPPTDTWAWRAYNPTTLTFDHVKESDGIPNRQLQQEEQLSTPAGAPASQWSREVSVGAVGKGPTKQETDGTTSCCYLGSPNRRKENRNRRRRRRTEIERTMHHAILWSGMGDVVPNVSVVTGEPLVRMPLPWTFGLGSSRKPKDEGDDLAVRLSRDLVREVEKRWAERSKRIKKTS